MFGNTGFGGLLKETTHGTEVRMQGNKPYFRKFEGLLQRSHINEKEERSESLCILVFDHYYVQASLPWALDDEDRGEAVFSRSDGFVKTVFDRFSEYEGI